MQLFKKLTQITAVILTLSLAGDVSGDSKNNLGSFQVEIMIRGLEAPWAVVPAEDGSLFITEKSGKIKVYKGGKITSEIKGLPQIIDYGQGGLMDLAFHPDFEENRLLYLAYTTGSARKYFTRVSRFKLNGYTLSDQKDLIDGGEGTDGAHFGSRIGFSPAGKLFITFGERHQKRLAQSLKTLHGKIVRLNDDGSIPRDNPFLSEKDANPAIFSIGHRNPQGLDFHPVTGAVYITEHGPSFYDAPSGGDEINLVEKGKNYGWPVIHHDEKKPGMQSPLRQWTPAIAPAGACFYKGSGFPDWKNHFLFATLRGMRLFKVAFKGGSIDQVKEFLHDDYGRMRDVACTDDHIFVITDGGLLLKISQSSG